MGDILPLGLLAALGLLLLAADIEDARRRTISNQTNLAVAALAPAWWWTQGYALWPDVAVQLLLASVVLLLFSTAFALNLMGGDDVKLIGALALWLPIPSLTSIFIQMAAIGGVLTALMIADEWVRHRAARPRPSPAAWLFALALVVAVALLANPGWSDWLNARPFLQLALIEAILVGVGVLLVMSTRAARRRGITPETPYGIAIAAASLLALREPLINQLA